LPEEADPDCECESSSNEATPDDSELDADEPATVNDADDDADEEEDADDNDDEDDDNDECESAPIDRSLFSFLSDELSDSSGSFEINRFHSTRGSGLPVAWQCICSDAPTTPLRSTGSRIHLGGAVLVCGNSSKRNQDQFDTVRERERERVY
jgi:hypothetical protein